MADRPFPAARPVAAALRRRLEDTGEPLATTLGEIRKQVRAQDPTVQHLTSSRRRALARELRSQGIVVPDSLLTVRSSEVLTLRLVGHGPITRALARLRRRAWPPVKRLALVVFALLELSGVILALLPYLRQEPPPEPPRAGGLKLAVAQLDVRGAGFDGKALDGKALGRSILDGPSDAPRLGDNDQVLVVGSHVLESPKGKTPAERVRVAAKVARSAGADALVSGRVETQGGRMMLRPEVYLSPSRVPGAPDIAGLHSLDAKPLAPAPNLEAVVAQDLRKRLIPHIQGLAQFAAGIDSLNGRDWKSAVKEFRDAADLVRTEGSVAMARLFAANVEGSLGRFSAAEHDYRAALRAPVARVQAHLGLNEIELHHATDKCFEHATAPAFRVVAVRFARQARAAARAGPADLDVVIHARLGSARANLCLSQGGAADRWSAATADLRAVIAGAIGAGDRFRDEIAEAHGGIGLALLSRPGRGRGDLLAARGEYESARDMAFESGRRAVFDDMLEFINEEFEREPAQPPRRAVPHKAPFAIIRKQVAYWQFGIDVIVSPDLPHDQRPAADTTAIVPSPANTGSAALQGGASRSQDSDVASPASQPDLQVAPPAPQPQAAPAQTSPQQTSAAPPVQPAPPAETMQPAAPTQDVEPAPVDQVQPPAPSPDVQPAAPARDAQQGAGAQSGGELQVAPPEPQPDVQVAPPAAQPDVQVARPAETAVFSLPLRLQSGAHGAHGRVSVRRRSKGLALHIRASTASGRSAVVALYTSRRKSRGLLAIFRGTLDQRITLPSADLRRYRYIAVLTWRRTRQHGTHIVPILRVSTARLVNGVVGIGGG